MCFAAEPSLEDLREGNNKKSSLKDFSDVDNTKSSFGRILENDKMRNPPWRISEMGRCAFKWYWYSENDHFIVNIRISSDT